MRSRIQKALAIEFAGELAQSYPQFSRTDQPRGTPPIWAWHYASTLTCFIMLQPFDDCDQFALELGWSEDGEYPWDTIAEVQPSNPRGRGRLAVWKGAKNEKVWDLAPEETAAIEARSEARLRGESVSYGNDVPVEKCLQRVQPFVRDAMQQLGEVGLPFLLRVADKHSVR